MPSITWHSFDLKSRRRLSQVTTRSQGTIERIIGEATDLSGLAVLCSENGVPVPGFDALTLPGRTMMVALNEDERPMWAGIVLRRRDTGSEWVELDLVSLEGYFDRRYVTGTLVTFPAPDANSVATAGYGYIFSDERQSAIVAGLVTGDVIPTGIQFSIDATSNVRRDRTYKSDEDKTVLSVLQELMEVEDGPDFTVDLDWTDSTRTVLNPILRVRDRLGTASSIPPAAFECINGGYSFIEDFSSENGANDVLATSSGEGESRPESMHAVADDLIAGGWLKFQERFQPSSSITKITTLNAHARSRLARMSDGAKILTVEGSLSDSPLPNRDFFLGDDVRVSITSPRFPERIGPDLDRVAGYTATVRCVGWSIDYDAETVTPMLLEVG